MTIINTDRLEGGNDTSNEQPETRLDRRSRRLTWRRLNVALHRDIGYLAFGLTIVYGVSGLAVNHRADWNPSVSTARTTRTIAPVQGDRRDALVEDALAKLGVAEKPRSSFQPNRSTLRLFFENTTYAIDLPTGKVVVERNDPRPVLYEFNALHLNTPKRVWTLIADAYAAALIVVAFTGLFVVKGRYGISGRCAVFTTIGVVLPAGYWLYHLFLE